MFNNKKDINKLNSQNNRIRMGEDELAIAAGATTKTVFSMFWKLFVTLFLILSIAGTLVLISVLLFIISLRDSEVEALESYVLNESSFVYVEDDDGEFVKYMTFHSTENRTWVDFEDIPDMMKNAQIAIEDQRFYEHEGVDWYATFGAAFKLLTGSDNTRGGSTITQQLVKNVTSNNEVSVLRKITEIFSALNLHEVYTHDEILEYYLNIVNYGYGAYGVEAASQLYFGKSITEASIAECAMIAGITQNPYYYTPVYYPENAETKARLVLSEMYSQGMITEEEYEQAVEETYNMNYAFGESSTGTTEEVVLDSSEVWNWYIETMFDDLTEDLCEELNVSKSRAQELIYSGGLEIYCAMDPEIQEGVEDIIVNNDALADDIQLGFYMMDYDGKVLAVVGSRYEKTGNLWTNWATETYRSPGSAIKPLSVYSLGIESGAITYSTMLDDTIIEDWFGEGIDGPYNYVSGDFKGWITATYALEISQNVPSARILAMVGVESSYNYLIDRFHLTTLVESDMNNSPLATGGMTYGVNVDEMTAAYQVFGNGGEYNEAYTYYYVLDSDGDIILDNTDNTADRAMSEITASIMNKMLLKVVNGSSGTASAIQMSQFTTFAKTGTTENWKDAWLMAGNQYAVTGMWSGYTGSTLVPVYSSTFQKTIWKQVMTYMYDNFWVYEEEQSFVYSDDLVSATYCADSGYLACETCTNTATGWYSASSLPRVCNSNTDHLTYESDPTTPEPEATPTLIPEPTDQEQSDSYGSSDDSDDDSSDSLLDFFDNLFG